MKMGRIVISIIVVFVAIILIGASVSVYGNPKKVVENKTNRGELKTFIVDWTLKNGALSNITDFVGKDAVYEKKIVLRQENLKKIVFDLEWEDDKALFGTFGLDSLTLTITSHDGIIYEEVATSARKTKEGSVAIEVLVNEIPSNDPIIAENLREAEEQLDDEPYHLDNRANKEFNVEVKVDVGEILGKIRPRDKGNSFELNVLYEYYTASLSED